MSLLDDAFALITTNTRSIGMLIPDVVVREVQRDEIVITDHPVERGAAISDHAFLRPPEVEMQIGWSDSTGGYVGYSREAYEALIALQKERQPFDLTTGNRQYENMLVTSVSLQKDEKSENISAIQCRLRGIIIVSTEMTGTPKSDQANPAKTGSTTNVGQQQLKSVSTSGFASPAQRS